MDIFVREKKKAIFEEAFWLPAIKLPDVAPTVRGRQSKLRWSDREPAEEEDVAMEVFLVCQ